MFDDRCSLRIVSFHFECRLWTQKHYASQYQTVFVVADVVVVVVVVHDVVSSGGVVGFGGIVLD